MPVNPISPTCDCIIHQERERGIEYQYRDTTSTLLSCRTCGMSTFYPPPTEQELTKYYVEEYADDTKAYNFDLAYSDLSIHDNAAKDIIQSLADCHPVNKDTILFDIGCGLGGIVNGLQRLGYHAHGHDLNTDWIEKAKAWGVQNLYSGSLKEVLDSISTPPDVFILSNVLEHVSNPRDFIRNLEAKISADGIILGCVPNGLYLPAQKFGRRNDPWFLWPQHLHHFSPRSLRCLARQFNLDLIKVWTTPVHHYKFHRDIFARARCGQTEGEVRHFEEMTKDAAKALLTNHLFFVLGRPEKHLQQVRDVDLVLESATPIHAMDLPVVKRDHVILFGESEEGNIYLLDGWKHPEPKFVWSRGVRSNLILPIDFEAPDGVEIKLGIYPLFVDKYRNQQRLKIAINGKNCFEEILSIGREYSLKTPPLKPGDMEINFDCPDAFSLRDAHINNDHYRLGFQLTHIHLSAPSSSIKERRGLNWFLNFLNKS